MSHLTRTQQRSQPRAGTRLPRTRQARQRGRQSAPWCWTRTRRPRRRSPRGRGTASTSWGCTPKRDRRPLHRPPGAPPATPTCSAPSWGPPRLLQRPPQATSLVARTPCSSQARPLPQARGARPTTAPAPRLPVRVLHRGASGGGGACGSGALRPGPHLRGGRGRGCTCRRGRVCRPLTSARLSGVSTADPFDALLLTSDLDAPAQPQPDPFCGFLRADPPAPPAPFPSAHSAPPPACSADFLQLGKRPRGPG